MLVLTAGTGQFATNVHVIAPGAGRTCLIVDPGHRSAPVVEEIVEEHRLRPEAVLLTHGHMDTWDAAPPARRHAVRTWIHPAGRHRLGAPERGLPADFPPDLLRGHPHREPETVRLLPPDGGTVGFCDARHLTTSIHFVRDRCPTQTQLLTGHGPGTTLGEIGI